MSTEVIMPQMGESIFEGTLLKWLKKPGDSVKRDEPLFEISTDKIDTEIPSPASGVLETILVPEGKTVPIKTVVAMIGSGMAGVAVHAPPSVSGALAGERSDPVPLSGIASEPAAGGSASAAPRKTGGATPSGERILSSPVVRRIAKEHGVDLRKIRGSGWRGRITKKDILDHVEGPKAPRETAAPLSPAPVAAAAPCEIPPAYRPILAGRHQVEPMSPVRARIADHMVWSKRISPHVTTVWEIDLTEVVRVRDREKADYERVYGAKLTFTPFFAYAAVQAIKDFPVVNAQVDGRNIVYRRDVNLGIAVSFPEGLIVPVVKGAEEKSFLGLARAIHDLAERARSKRLALDDVQGGTFTITNPGVFGGLFGTPIINQPQVAILGIGAIEKRPVVRGDAIAIRDTAYVVLSFDHRLIDGATADQYMAKMKETLQTWNVPVK